MRFSGASGMLTSETAGFVPSLSLQRKQRVLRRERPGRLLQTKVPLGRGLQVISC